MCSRLAGAVRILMCSAQAGVQRRVNHQDRHTGMASGSMAEQFGRKCPHILMVLRPVDGAEADVYKQHAYLAHG
jgi:hypothetical protein